jgi:NADPH2:quinone reductase
MTVAVRVHETGGPEVLRVEEVAVGEPGPGEVRLKQTAIGVNFVDVYRRSGLYQMPLPFVPGSEAAGTVTAVGPDVTEFGVGDRVAYCTAPTGGYAGERLIEARFLVRLPDAIDDVTAAASMLRGLTAAYLLRRTHVVGPGQTILVHAAAGGVGLIMCQWASHLGATVIGTVGTPEKAALARANGCAHPILDRDEDFVARVKEITGGEGCEVVYDSVGKSVFPGSLDCVKPLGLWALFGQASGSVPPFDLQMLAQRGSLFATRPTLFTYAARRPDLLALAGELFGVLESGAVTIKVGERLPLAEAAEAHRRLEGRRTTGSTILLP